MSQPIRVLHFTTDSHIAGTERMILSLFQHFDRTAFDFQLATLFGPGDLIRESQRLSVPAVQLDWNRAVSPGALVRLFSLMRRFRPHVLQCYLFHSNMIGRVAGRILRTPVIVSGLRTFYEDSAQGRRQRAWDRRTFFLTHYCLANSEAGADSLYGRDERSRARIEVVHNGLASAPYQRDAAARQQLRREWSVPEHTFLFGMIAQLRRHKDHATLLSALAKVPEARMVLVGSGETEGEVRAMVARLRLEGRVTLAGYRRDVARVLSALDAFVLSSEIEGLPVSIMEAMAAGLPVVATRIGGVPELVRDGETGLLTSLGDADGLAAAMRRLTGDPALCARLGEAGAARIRRDFSPQAMTRKIEAFYRRVAGAAP
ncbi:glycosyltransferase [bacterium]|nr:glycosyltransferase [bacterium]